MKQRPHSPVHKSVEYLLTEFTRSGKQVTTKLPEQWLTIREVNKEEEQQMADIYSIDGKRLATGSTPPIGDDWLAGMKVGTVFVCELKADMAKHMGMQGAIQQEYAIERKDGKSILLMSNLNEPVVYARINSERFCQFHDLVVVLFEPQEEQQNASY